MSNITLLDRALAHHNVVNANLTLIRAKKSRDNAIIILPEDHPETSFDHDADFAVEISYSVTPAGEIIPNEYTLSPHVEGSGCYEDKEADVMLEMFTAARSLIAIVKSVAIETAA